MGGLTPHVHKFEKKNLQNLKWIKTDCINSAAQGSIINSGYLSQHHTIDNRTSSSISKQPNSLKKRNSS